MLRNLILLFLTVNLLLISTSLFAKTKEKSTKEFTNSNQACLIAAGRMEANGLPNREVIPVMYSTKNRLNYPKQYPDNICDIVLQKGQFQMTSKLRSTVRTVKKTGKMTFEDFSEDEYKRLQNLSGKILSGEISDPTNGATHFYSPKLRLKMGLSFSPPWARKMPLKLVTDGFRFHGPYVKKPRKIKTRK
jgi:spore germination cell wall hydrolase CwlJ-like protein